jgi:lipoprotein-releasing system permease protein
MGNSIFIGKGIADKMMVEVGDMLQVTTPRGQLASLKVMGIIQFGLADLDNVVSYTSLPTAQKLLGKPAAYVTDIQVKLTDLDQAPAMAKAYSSTYGVEAADIQTANAQFDTGSSIRSTISYAVGITLLIVAGFGIYNILNMLIYEKMDTIAILKATGFSGRDVQWIFILLSLIIGVSGGIMGLGIGYLLSVGIDQVPFETEALPTIKTFPVYYNPAYYFIGITFALITTYLAGLLPARKAAQVDPVIIIRGK